MHDCKLHVEDTTNTSRWMYACMAFFRITMDGGSNEERAGDVVACTRRTRSQCIANCNARAQRERAGRPMATLTPARAAHHLARCVRAYVSVGRLVHEYDGRSRGPSSRYSV